MKFYELLTPELVVLDFKAKDKIDALEKMLDYLIGKKKLLLEHKKIVLNSLIAREKIATTAVDHEIAFPHASADVLTNLIALFAVSYEGVPFEAPDGKNSRILALLLVPKKELGRHSRTLASIARVLSSEQTRKAIMEAKTPSAVYQIIKSEEEKS